MATELEAYETALRNYPDRPTDLSIVATVENEARRSADFQGLAGKVREAYLAGQYQGASAAMAILRERGILRPKTVVLANGEKMSVYQF